MLPDPFLVACAAISAYVFFVGFRHDRQTQPRELYPRLAAAWGVGAVCAWYLADGTRLIPTLFLAAGSAWFTWRAYSHRPRPGWWDGEHERIEQA